jgi:acylphosphatase
MPVLRRRLIVRGRVQGVGFRATAAHLARGFPIGGSVRNLPDGTVEVVAEGEASAVAAFLDALGREMADRIRDSHAADEPPTGDASGDFIIRYD